MDVTDRTVAHGLETIAMKLAFDDRRPYPEGGDHARVEQAYLTHRGAGLDALASVHAAARDLGAFGTCDWCGEGPVVFAVDSTAGRRCRDCHDTVLLCGWCGEGPVGDDGDHDIGHCARCRRELERTG